MNQLETEAKSNDMEIKTKDKQMAGLVTTHVPFFQEPDADSGSVSVQQNYYRERCFLYQRCADIINIRPFL